MYNTTILRWASNLHSRQYARRLLQIAFLKYTRISQYLPVSPSYEKSSRTDDNWRLFAADNERARISQARESTTFTSLPVFRETSSSSPRRSRWPCSLPLSHTKPKPVGHDTVEALWNRLLRFSWSARVCSPQKLSIALATHPGRLIPNLAILGWPAVLRRVAAPRRSIIAGLSEYEVWVGN